jgi:hypothetical protein
VATTAAAQGPCGGRLRHEIAGLDKRPLRAADGCPGPGSLWWVLAEPGGRAAGRGPYGLRLAGLLREYSWDVRTGRIALLEEAVTAGRLSPLRSAHDVRRFVNVLDSYQFALYESGRRAEGFEVCAELGRLARRADDGSLPGLAVWARCLAEAGQHAEAADACAELMVLARPPDGSTWSGRLWDIIRFVAQAHAAGRSEQAHAVLADAIEVDREFVDRGEGPERVLLHLLVYRAWMLRTDGRGRAAATVDRDVLAVLGNAHTPARRTPGPPRRHARRAVEAPVEHPRPHMISRISVVRERR